MILLDHDLSALPDRGQHGMDATSKFGFSNAVGYQQNLPVLS
jgi:hypothetical protein